MMDKRIDGVKGGDLARGTSSILNCLKGCEALSKCNSVGIMTQSGAK